MSLAVFAQAQTLTASFNGVIVNDGDTLSAQATGDELKFEPSFNNNGTTDITARIVVDRIGESETMVTSVCTGLLCMSGNMSAPFKINAMGTYADAYIDFYVPENAPVTRFKISCYDTNYQQTRTEFYLKVYNANATIGIASAEAGETLTAYPNPTWGTVSIRYSNAAESGTLAVYDMKGMLVLDVVLTEREGTVLMDMSNLPAGLNLYGIKGSTMKKLIVR